MRVLKFIAMTALMLCLIWFVIQDIEQVNDTPTYETGVECGEAVVI